jgi:hypothetical protein
VHHLEKVSRFILWYFSFFCLLSATPLSFFYKSFFNFCLFYLALLVEALVLAPPRVRGRDDSLHLRTFVVEKNCAWVIIILEVVILHSSLLFPNDLGFLRIKIVD